MAANKSLCGLVGGMMCGYGGALLTIAYGAALGPAGALLPVAGAIGGMYAGRNSCE